jgi:hypothetical protein
MSNKRRHLKRRQARALKSKKPVARVAKVGLILGISLLIVILAVLILRLGIGVWPAWLIDHRRLFIAIFSVIAVFLTVMSPVIIEVNSHPRPLSGPGKNPESNLPLD